MPKSKSQHSYNFGRVFFPVQSNPNPALPNEIRFQPLGNHVGNVKKLAKKWKDDNFSLERVVKGIDLHDVGKPQKFEILAETNKSGKFKKYIYSFRGHRFLAECPQDIWAQTLARGHHDYSVTEITKDTYKLQKNPAYADTLAQDPLMYARELYIVEMCDQIEAELACRIIGDEEQAESRTFMDYTITKDKSEVNVYRIDPYPFKDEFIELTFQSWSYWLSDDDKNELQKIRNDGQDVKLGKTLDKLAKNWWQKNEGKPDKNSELIVILKPYESKDAALLSGDATYWYEKLANFKPNPMQEEIFKAIVETENPAFILKAPTGVGKFEAIIIPFLANLSKSNRDSYRLILPLPSRSLLEDQKQRCEKYLKQFSRLHQGREVSLVVDTGTQMHRYVYRDGEDLELNINPRRHLYKGDIILTTIDKFMYRYFGYGDKQKSFIFPYRINHGNTLICFDEAHSYDDISFTNFCSLIKALYEAGRSLILMTATLPETHIQRFDYLEDNVIDYIDNQENLQKLNNFQRQTLKQDYPNLKQFEWINDLTSEAFHETFATIIIKEWKSNSNHRIIVSVETVKDAVAIYQKLKEELGINNNQEKILFLYHGRLPDIPKSSEFSRTNIYQRIKEKDENNQPYILMTTSAIEVGCDLNSTLLISQLCNPESLIQRAGRCNRKGNIKDAKIILIGSSIPKFANSLTATDLESYKKTLQILHGQNFDPYTIMNCVSQKQQVDDYRVVELFSMLQDYVYNADLTCQPAYEKGLVITRSWTPSVTLMYDDGSHENDLEKIAKNAPQITIPIDRLILKKDEKGNYKNQYANLNVYEWIYNKEETRYILEPLKYWGWAYNKDIVVKIDKFCHGEMSDYDYSPELGFKDLPGVFIKWRSTNYEEKLQYKTTEDKSVVITYIKALTEE